MPVTEVQWIGASCGRHSSYTFYRGFRLIVDGVEKKFCLGEFYFVRNSTNQPICIAELQLVWHDASTDSQLASARLYFRPEDTPVGRLPNHGQDELLYADQKVVIKCHDMAVWQDSGVQWNCGMVPLYESDFVCIEDRYYLNSRYAVKEKERTLKAREAWQNGDHPRSLQILTFPAYCRYRALKKRLLSGVCLSRAQLVALGGVLGEQTSRRVLFCRDSIHHPYLDKFELSGDNKAPVLKGRPRKKKRLNAAQNSVLKKRRFVADIQNHLTNSPAAKRCKLSEEEESASSDVSEGVLERIRVPPQAARVVQSNGPPPLVKPRVQAISAKPSEVPKATAQNVPLANPKAPPPLISSNAIKDDARRATQPRRDQVNVKVIECSRTTPMQKQIFSMDAKLRRVEQSNNNNNNNTALLVKSRLADNIQPRVTSAPLASSSPSLKSRTDKILNSSIGNNQLSQPHPEKTVANTYIEHTRTILAGQADTHRHTSSSTRPLATTQGTVGTQLAVSISPAVRSQPVASLPQPISSAQAIAPKSQQFVTPLAGSVSTTVKVSDVVNSGGPLPVRSKPSKENEDWQSRPACVAEEKKENEIEQTDEAVVWKKKKKRLRMPGSVKDEVYDDEDEKYFMQTLRDFMRKSNQPLGKLPALGFKKVNLWTMYNTAQRFGGYDAVTSKRLWRRVYDSLGGSTTITSAATYTRRHYERLLLPYERHIRSQLKKQMDEKNPSVINNPATKEPLNKPEKKQGLTVSNNKPKPSTCPDMDKAPAVKKNQGASPAKTQQNNTALSSSIQALPAKMIISSDSNGNAVKTTYSGHAVHAATTSATNKHPPNKEAFKHASSPATVRSVKQEHQESKTWIDKAKASVSQAITLPAEKREKVIPSEQFQLASSQHNTNYRSLKVMGSDEETSARTNTIYTKHIDAGNNNLKHGAPLQKVTRIAHDGTPVSTLPQQLITAIKGREIIDLTSEDSPPRPHSRLPHVQGSQGNPQETSKVSRPVSGRDGDRKRHTSKSQSRKEFRDSRHQSNRDVQPSREMSPIYEKQTYSAQHQGKSRVSPQLPDNSPVSRVESMDGRFTHSPSSDSVDEHFAEWLRRQSSVPQQHTKSHVSHQRQTGNPDLGKLRYNYINEDMCPPDCSCSLPTSRKDEIMSVPPPKPKKEHYEEELPFAGMTLYPGRWSPTMIAPDHPDLYIPSHAAHLRAPADSLANHMCTASRIFIPSAQIFSPPYHLGMGPMGAAPLIAGTDDQLHIHPHCLMASSYDYPCTSSSRTPDGASYPLYSFT